MARSTTAVAQPLEAARQAIVAAYPELQVRSARFKAEVLFSSINDAHPWRPPWLVGVSAYENKVVGGRGSDVLLCHVEVWLDALSRVIGLRTSGDFVGTARLERVRGEIQRHPNWSDEQALMVLRREGARFLPDKLADAGVVLGDRLHRLRTVLGPVELRSPEFTLREPDALTTVDPGTQGGFIKVPVVAASWSVQFTVVPPDDRPTMYRAEFEPFDGLLLSVEPRFAR